VVNQFVLIVQKVAAELVLVLEAELEIHLKPLLVVEARLETIQVRLE